MTETSDLRARVARLIESPMFVNSIMGLIIVNAITLGLETSDRAMASFGTVLIFIDRAVLAVFVLEIVLKLFAYRLGFFRSGWNVFDFIIVAIALMPASGALSVMRSLRILRALRLFSLVPQMRTVIGALLAALPGMGSVVLVLSLVYYVFAVMATKLYGETFPEWFGSVGASLYSLFQITTLESWSMGIVRPVMEVHPYAWAFFVPFIVTTAFAVLNLFIGILVSAMQDAVEKEHEQEAADLRELVEQSTRDIRAELAEMRALLIEAQGRTR